MSVRDMSIEELLAEAVGTAPKPILTTLETSVPTPPTADLHRTEDQDLEDTLVAAVAEAIRRVLRERGLR